ncbi:monocarboxylate transporter 12 [Parasteatoda tepidariorum]|nr:monocarboxylate transporter 12 [Parasteatoda tepidariorum]
MVVVKRDSMKKTSDLTMPVPPDGGWGWVVVFASFMIHVIADGVTYTFGIFYVEFLKYYGSSKGTTAWVASIMVGTTYCIGPIASGLTNKYGCRAVTIAGAILASAGLMLSTISPNVQFLFFSIGLCTGSGFGLMYLPSIVSVTCYFEKQRAFATGIAVCGSGMGTFALAPLTEILVENYGWKGAMMIIAALVLNCTVFGALFRPLEAASSPQSKQVPRIKKPNLPKLKINGSLSNGKLPTTTEDGNSPSTPLMFQANGHVVSELVTKKNPDDTLSADSRLTNGFAKNGDISPKVQLPPGYSTNPSTPSEVMANGFSKDIVLRSNGHGPEKKNDRNSLMLPGDFLRRKVEGTALSSFVCSSASLAQTNKELSQLEYACPQSRSGGLLCRKDIFYSGSMISLAKYQSNPNISYSAVHPIDAEDEFDHKKRFKCCPKEIRDALAEMTDFAILKDPIFLMFAVSNFLTSIGFNVPYVYTKDRVSEMGMASNEDASFLLAIIGISNTVGRVTLGYLSDRSCVNRLWIYNTSLIICGLATALSCYALNYTLMACYCATFGATAGAYVSLTSVILVDLLGLDKLTNAFGILLVFEGVSCLLGPPITGWLYDGLGSYDPGFVVSGSMIAASGLILFLVPCISKRPNHHPSNPEDPVPKIAETST